MADGAALVTGGKSGIGAAIVEAIARSGRPVAFTYCRDREADEVAAVALLLGSEAADYLTGATGAIDGA